LSDADREILDRIATGDLVGEFQACSMPSSWPIRCWAAKRPTLDDRRDVDVGIVAPLTPGRLSLTGCHPRPKPTSPSLVRALQRWRSVVGLRSRVTGI
jgi:hypothetical protein